MTLLKVLLVISVIGQPISCESEEESLTQYSTEISVIENGEVRKLEPQVTTEELSTSTTETPDVTTQPPKTNRATFRGSVKYGQKPFFYGRKFQLPKEAKNQYKVKEGGLVSPIIMSPIRALSAEGISKVPETDPEVLKQNQNEIFSSIRDFLNESTESSFNKTYFSEEANESENHGGEINTETPKKTEVEEDGGQEVASRSRQDGDRSLMLVLPFKANEDNMQELFTKSPLVKVIEDDIVDIEKVTTNPPYEREIQPLTQQPENSAKKRRRPFKRYKITTEPSTTTTESEEDVTKTYTNYNDVEMITKKYENPAISYENFNHKEELDVTTPYPIQKLLKNKLKEDASLESFSFTEKPKPKRKNQRRKPTTEGPPKGEELTKVLEILPPDMKDLLLQIGLNKENKETPNTDVNFQLDRAPKPSIDPMSFAVFKPLPLESRDENKNFVSDDMKDFLASFGLLPTGKRVQKSLKPQPPKKQDEELSTVDFDFLPDDLKSVLEDMGLVKNLNKKEPTRIHIFNPNNHSIAETDEDFEKVNAILTSIKSTVNESQSLSPEMQTEIIQKIKELNNLRFKNGNLSEINNEIKKIVVNKQGGESKSRTARRATKLLDGPDPLMFSDDSVSKNDVKRQESSSSASSSASSSSSDSGDSSSAAAAQSSASSDGNASASSSASSSVGSGTVETTTEEGPNIEALKESFGGGETASDDADIDSNLPPKRPNGLYLLLDWNSFLEVGTDDDNRRVNLRFQPKIGDSRNFLPVSVP